MVKNKIRLNKFYRGLLKKENIPYQKAVQIYEALRKEAVSLRIFNSRNVLEGIEVDIKIAKAINSLR
jgi:tRNA isopentenyl-2-thiomethyl-A-37 hydroxylase MiaE